MYYILAARLSKTSLPADLYPNLAYQSLHL